MSWIFKRNPLSRTKIPLSANDEASESDRLLMEPVDHNSSTHETLIDDAPSILRKIPDKIPPTALNIVLVHLCERFTFYSLSGLFPNYLKNPLPPGGNGSGAPPKWKTTIPAGALGLGHGVATMWQSLFQVGVYRFFCEW